MQKIKKIDSSVLKKSKIPKIWVFDVPQIPRLLFLNSDTWASCCRLLVSIAMKKIKKTYSTVSKKMSKCQYFDIQSPANPWTVLFEAVHLGQMLHSVALYHHAKRQKK